MAASNSEPNGPNSIKRTASGSKRIESTRRMGGSCQTRMAFSSRVLPKQRRFDDALGLQPPELERSFRGAKLREMLVRAGFEETRRGLLLELCSHTCFLPGYSETEFLLHEGTRLRRSQASSRHLKPLPLHLATGVFALHSKQHFPALEVRRLPSTLMEQA